MEPLVVEFEVAAPPDHAFEVWTARTALWWPPSHTVTGSRDISVVFEPFPGGRIYERDEEGLEHEWGEIIAWEPPQRVAYLWHLFFDRSEATEVDVTFEGGEDGTRVRIRQTGWQHLGAQAEGRRTTPGRAWAAIVPLFREAVTRR